MRLADIIHGIAIDDRRGRLENEIGRITIDSRQVQEGDLFVAIRGTRMDGHQFIRHAIERGAQAVVAESWPEGLESAGKPDVVLVPNSRRALALVAANFYEQPTRKLLVAGVTGTNGKTTVSYILDSIFRAASRKVGLVGTVDCRYGDHVIPTNLTTPDPVFLEKLFQDMSSEGVTHVVMEVSSHAMAQERVAGVHFKVVGFTNFSQDHLDYHDSIEEYFASKARLFSHVLRRSRARGRMAVINIDDPRGPELMKLWGGKTLRVSVNPDSDAEVVVVSAQESLEGTEATVRTPKGEWKIRTALIGQHNVSNIAVGVGMALAMGFSRTRVIRGLEALERVPGRVEPVPNPDGKTVLVDYAHTPDALDRMLSSVKRLTKGRLIVVFGCGGDRDRSKRPLMGKAAAAHADLAFVTNDNPRSEDPMAIADAVAGGLVEAGWTKANAQDAKEKAFVIELDRRAAIRAALTGMTDDDVVVIAGKGHETWQIMRSEKHRFDDREEALRILKGEPPPPPEVIKIVPPPPPDVSDVPKSAAPRQPTDEVEAVQVLSEVDAEGGQSRLTVETPAEPQAEEAPSAVAKKREATNEIEALQVIAEEDAPDGQLKAAAEPEAEGDAHEIVSQDLEEVVEVASADAEAPQAEQEEPAQVEAEAKVEAEAEAEAKAEPQSEAPAAAEETSGEAEAAPAITAAANGEDGQDGEAKSEEQPSAGGESEEVVTEASSEPEEKAGAPPGSEDTKT